MIRTVDYEALTAPIAPGETAAFRAAHPQWAGASQTAQVIGGVVVFTIMAVMIFGFMGFMAGVAGDAAAGGSPVAIAFILFPLFVFGVLLFAAVSVVKSLVTHAGRWSRWMRYDRFATANGLVFSPDDAEPAYPGAIFSQGHRRRATDHFRSATDRFLDYGNFTYKTGSGKNESTHHWGFLALQLDRALPHMVLDARANNGLFGGTNLPAVFARDQVLHLEGDFDKHFTLYAPREYERDALYVFTPDLMALLIDEVSPYDVEIIDTWMFVYSASPFELRDPAVHQRLLRIVDLVGSKTISQSDRYSDDRVGDFAANTVAPQGARLKRGISVGAVIFFVAFAVLWGGPVVAGMLGLID